MCPTVVQVWTTDVCVPLSRMADCIVQTKEDIAKSHLIAPLVGHVGDGNFHVFFLLDPSNKEDMAEAQRLNARMVRRAIEMEGTCTGEHGVGVGKTVRVCGTVLRCDPARPRDCL